MQIEAATRMPSVTMARASSPVWATSARAAARAYGPPEPIPIRPSSGSITSPVPETMNEYSWSPTASGASRRRSTRSLRQSLASSTAARARLPRYSSSLPSKRANSVKASAAAPAKPATTRSWCSLRTLRAPALTIVCTSVTWPSPPTPPLPRWRTQRTVVAWNVSDMLGALGARVGLVVDPGQLLAGHVRVTLRGGQPAVPQQLLDHAQVGPAVEQVRREGVAQRVRAHPPGKNTRAGRGGRDQSGGAEGGARA